MTAILVSGAEGFALIFAGAWLVYTKRIVLAATPKAPPPQPAAPLAAHQQESTP